MKIEYKGQELETITEGYWPDGVTLVFCDEYFSVRKCKGVVCLRNGVAPTLSAGCTAQWKYWAVLQPKPAVRRLTNREALALCRKGGQAKSRYDAIKTAGHHIAYVLDGAGNFQRESAIKNICDHSDCTVGFKESEMHVLASFIKDII